MRTLIRRRGLAAIVSGLLLVTSVNSATAVTYGPDFSSTFNGSSIGWGNVIGRWSANSFTFNTAGATGKMASARRGHIYSNFTMSVRAKVTGFAGYVWFRGKALSATTTTNGFWPNAYAIGWTNGQFAVFRTDGTGVSTTLVPQQANAAIVVGGYNLIKIIAVDGIIGFVINGVPVAAIIDAAQQRGMVGLGFFSTGTGVMSVDSASLIKLPESADTPAALALLKAASSAGTPAEPGSIANPAVP